MAPGKDTKPELEREKLITQAVDPAMEKKVSKSPSRQQELNDVEFDQKMFRVVLRLLVFVTVVLLTILTRFWGLSDPPHIW